MTDISKESYQESYQDYVEFEKVIMPEYDVIGKIMVKNIRENLSKENIKVLDVGGVFFIELQDYKVAVCNGISNVKS